MLKNIFFVIIIIFVINTNSYAEKMRIAVMDFIPKGVSKIVASNTTELIRVEMINMKKYTVIERSQMGNILKEQGFQQTGCTSVSCAIKAGKLLSARKILIGSVMKLGSKYIIAGRIVDVEKGIAEFSQKQEVYSIDELSNAAIIFSSKLGNRIKEVKTISRKRKAHDDMFIGDTIDDYMPDSKTDGDMKILKAEREPFSISYGGWITPVIIDERKGTALTSSVTTTKLWIKSTLWRNSFLYLRGKDVFFRVINEEDIDVDDTENLIDLDVGFIGMSNRTRTLNLYIGRKFFILGTGLIFNGRGDGGEFNFYSRFVNIKLFGAYTGLLKKDNNPYGLSDKDISDGSKRVFTGGMIQKDFMNQSVYLLGLAQIDQQDEEEGEYTRYQSQYYGAGVSGSISDFVEYYGEFIYETGKSYMSGTDEEGDIKAFAGILGFRSYFDTAFNPVLLFQYSYGSGDEDRNNTRSPTGNQLDDDTGFLPFGTFVGGYALRPLLSNIHIVRLGFALTPFYSSSSRSLRRMNIIAKYSYYMKDKTEGVINYGEATLEEKEIGHGVDTAIRWRIFYDLSVFVTYAIFIPGDAYASSEENRHFIMGGFNIIF